MIAAFSGETAVMGTASWRVHFVEETASTNDLARSLPVWSAVVAERQWRGRGRFGRRFVSGAGGLWLTAVVPAPLPASQWAGLSLALGWKLLELFEQVGVPSVRLRWPNDLMSGTKKFAGLLIEQSGPERLAVGLGCNVLNKPWEADSALRATAARLADLCPQTLPAIRDLVPPVLNAIAEAHHALLLGGLEKVVEELNARWERRRVILHLHGGTRREGLFAGLNSRGDVLLETSPGSTETISHPLIERLEEILP